MLIIRRYNLDDLRLVASDVDSFFGWCGPVFFMGIINDLDRRVRSECPWPGFCPTCPLYDFGKRERKWEESTGMCYVMLPSTSGYAGLLTFGVWLRLYKTPSSISAVTTTRFVVGVVLTTSYLPLLMSYLFLYQSEENMIILPYKTRNYLGWLHRLSIKSFVYICPISNFSGIIQNLLGTEPGGCRRCYSCTKCESWRWVKKI